MGFSNYGSHTPFGSIRDLQKKKSKQTHIKCEDCPAIIKRAGIKKRCQACSDVHNSKLKSEYRHRKRQLQHEKENEHGQ